MADKELTLGTLFTGRVDESFRGAVHDLRTLLDRLHKTALNTSGGMMAAGTGTKNLDQALVGTGKQISKVSGGFQRLTAAFKVTAAYSIAAKAIWGTVDAFKAGIEVIFEYDQALKNLQAITGASEAEASALGVAIKRVASDTKYSAKEVADAAIILGQAGFTASEALVAIDAVAMLATGTLSDMTKTADLLTTAIRAFGEDASESGRISDIFASAVNRSKLTIDKIRTAFNYLGPISRQAGLSLEETAAAAMLLANAGLRASTIGTGFRQVLARLVNPSQKLRLIFKSTGADMEKLNPATSSLTAILGELEKVLGKNVDASIRAQRAFALFGLRGASVAATFAQQGAAGLEKMLNEVYRVGTATTMAEKQMEGLGVMAKNLSDKIHVLAVTLGEGGIAGAFRVILELLRPFVDLLIKIAATMGGKFLVAVTALTAIIAVLRITIKYLVVQIYSMVAAVEIAAIKTDLLTGKLTLLSIVGKTVTRIMKTLWLALLAHPWIGVTALIAGAIVGLVTWNRHQEQARLKLEETVVVLDSEIESLEKYKTKLSDATTNQRTHSSIMERLIREYPELSKVVDFATMKFTDEGKVLDELIKKKAQMRIQARVDLSEAALRQKKAFEDRIGHLERAKKDLGEEEWFGKDVAKTTENLKLATGEWNKYIKDIAEGVRIYGLSAQSSVEDITKIITTTFGVSTSNAKEYANSILEYYNALESSQKTTAVQVKQMVDDQAAMLLALGKQWYDLFVSFSGKPGKQAELLLYLDEIQKKITKMGEAGKNIGLTPTQIDALIEGQYAKAYKSFIEKETDKQRKVKETFDSMEVALLKFADLNQQADEREALANKEKRDAKIKDFEEESDIKKGLFESEKVYRAELSKIDKDYFDKRMKFYADINDISAKSLDDRQADELKASHEKLRAKTEEAKKLIKNESVLSEVLVSMEQLAAEERLRIIQAFTDKKIEEYNKEQKRIIKLGGKLQKEREREEKKTADTLLEINKNLYKHYLTIMDEYLRKGELTAEQYVEIIKGAHKLGLISAEEMKEKMIAINGTWLDQFAYGLDRSAAKIESWGQFIVDIGKSISEKISTEFSSSFVSFAEGTKTASEAFEDFAKNVIKWLLEMIVKQYLLNTLAGVTSGFGRATSGTAPAVAGAGSPSPITRQHGGWINEPVIGLGVRSKRPYTIAERGPEYVSKGGGSPPSGEVKVIVNNNTGTEAKAKSEVGYDANGMIVTVVLDALNRNKMGFRDSIRGVR